jgi:glycosyl-4,4'-diaponeurosporenoate acyltransferase
VSDAEFALLDVFAWLAVHLAVGYGVHRLPERALAGESWWSRERAFERGGALYGARLRIRRWKAYLPEAGAVFPGGFDKARLRSRDPRYLRSYLVETQRAELGHLLALAAAPFFFLWNPPWLGWCMQVYALAANVPCVLSQRYNRARLRRVLARAC